MLALQIRRGSRVKRPRGLIPFACSAGPGSGLQVAASASLARARCGVTPPAEAAVRHTHARLCRRGRRAAATGNSACCGPDRLVPSGRELSTR